MDENTKIVTLGGREFPVPPLPIGVMKKLWPITYRMAQRHLAALQAGHGQFSADSESIDDMLDVIFHGISFATKITREEFDTIVTSLPELMAASRLVSVQAGGKVEPGKPVAATAIEQPSSPTGTSS